jgi:hypothetical protein
MLLFNSATNIRAAVAVVVATLSVAIRAAPAAPKVGWRNARGEWEP